MGDHRLNESQRKAVLHGEGPCACIAGAGAGKTLVLTERIARLVERGERPESVLAMTFTKKAAQEMEERVAGLVGAGPAEALSVCTIHSLCYRILREEWRSQGVSREILTDYWQRRYFKDLLAAPGPRNPDGLNWEVDLRAAIAKISRLKNDLVGISEYRERADEEEDGRRWLEVYRAYEARKDREGRVDFDDMLLWCWRLLKENPAVLSRWQRGFKWILVDEFQDTNRAQWETIRMLSEPRRNLFVVGDDWQAIYGFRGARPDLIVNFREEYPEAEIIVLDLNYRSLPHIVEHGNRLIGHNGGQFSKRLLSTRTSETLETVRLNPRDEDEEGSLVASEIEAMVEAGEWSHGQVAVLYRTNAQSLSFEDAFVERSIPYVVVGSAGFYGRKEVKDLVAYLELLEDPSDEDAYSRSIMAPSRFLGRQFVSQVVSHARRAGIDLLSATDVCPGLKGFQRRAANKFVDLFQMLTSLQRPSDMIHAVREVTDYDRWFLRDDAGEEGDDGDRLGNLRALESVAAKFATVPAFLKHVRMMASKAQNQNTTGKVVLSTVHRAKGLEWPVVFVAGCSQGLLPHKASIPEVTAPAEECDGLWEERRLCYVAITRARDVLYVSSPGAYQGKSLDVSQFVLEMSGAEVAIS